MLGRRLSIIGIIGLAGVLWGVSAVSIQGATIIHTNQAVDLGGAGFGNIPPALTLQDKTGNNEEWGGVQWDGSQDVYVGDDMVASENNELKTQTITAQTLWDEGVRAHLFGIVFNINEANNEPEVVLSGFEVVFYLANGSESFKAVYTPPTGGLELVPAGQGQGQAGHLFQVIFDDTEFADFFADGNNRVGLNVPTAITLVSDGTESFLIAAVPEPATLGLLALGSVGYLIRRRRG